MPLFVALYFLGLAIVLMAIGALRAAKLAEDGPDEGLTLRGFLWVLLVASLYPVWFLLLAACSLLEVLVA